MTATEDYSHLKEFECAICIKLLLEPVTTPCGHNFCKECLEQTVEYRPACPLCRKPLPSGGSTNLLLSRIIEEKYPNEMKQRQLELAEARTEREREVQKDRQREAASLQNLPFFFLSNNGPVFPGETITLNIFESRYISMINSILQGDQRFGIIELDKNTENDQLYGTCIEIVYHSYTSTNHRRYLVKGEGKFRFRVVGLLESSAEGFEFGRCEAVFDKTLQISSDYNLFPDITQIESVSESSDSHRLTHDNRTSGRNPDIHETEISSSGEVNTSSTTSSSCISWLLNRFSWVPNPSPVISDSLQQGYANFLNQRDSCENRNEFLLAKMLIDICKDGLTKQLDRAGESGCFIFNQKYGPAPSLSTTATSSDIEKISFYFCKILMVTRQEKYKWFLMTDTIQRLEEVAKIFLGARSRCILDFRTSSISLSANFFLLDNSRATLICLAFLLIVIGWKLYFSRFTKVVTFENAFDSIANTAQSVHRYIQSQQQANYDIDFGDFSDMDL